jgi:NAD-dependent deacetylase
MVRPGVVWFGEMLPPEALRAAGVGLRSTDVILVIGTSGLVSPAADMPRIAQTKGAKIIEINPDYSMITRFADLKLEGRSGEVLPRIVEALSKE